MDDLNENTKVLLAMLNELVQVGYTLANEIHALNENIEILLEASEKPNNPLADIAKAVTQSIMGGKRKRK